jgi:hypothetical protein
VDLGHRNFLLILVPIRQFGPSAPLLGPHKTKSRSLSSVVALRKESGFANDAVPTRNEHPPRQGGHGRGLVGTGELHLALL